MSFVHLHVHSPFSFLDGAGRIEEMVTSASAAGMPSLALTDHNNLCAAILFSGLAKQAGIKPVTGVEITLRDDSHLTLLAKNPHGYTNLCRILSAAHLGNPRETPRTSYETLRAYSSDLAALSGCRKGRIPQLILKGHYRLAEETAQTFADIFGRENFFIEMQQDFLPGSRFLTSALDNLASHLRLKTAATNNVHYVTKEQFKIHDLLTCVRTLTKLEEIHPERRLNAENYLKSPAERARFLVTIHRQSQIPLLSQKCANRPWKQGTACFPPSRTFPPGKPLPVTSGSLPLKEPGSAIIICPGR